MTSPDGDAELDMLYQQYATHIRPLITQISADQWRAQYPGLTWHVTAGSEQAASDEITKEALRRLDADQDDAQPPHDLLKRHLANPISGVYALDRELFLYLRGHAGRAETQRAFEEAERRRAQGRSYTKNDYLIEQLSWTNNKTTTNPHNASPTPSRAVRNSYGDTAEISRKAAGSLTVRVGERPVWDHNCSPRQSGGLADFGCAVTASGWDRSIAFRYT